MKFIEDVIESAFECNNIIFKSKTIENLSSSDIDELNNFHMNELFIIEKDDEYFCGIRANHFCIECGISENYNDRIIVLITANHKAFRTMTMLYFYKNFNG